MQRPGLKRDHPDSREANLRGSVRVYSKALVETNRKLGEGKIEFRGVEQVYPVGGEPGAQASDRISVTARKRWFEGRQGSNKRATG